MKTLRLIPLVLLLIPVLSVTGCPHRSPLWSPDGKRLLVLGGETGEEVDQPASRLWLVDVEKGKATRLEAPEKDARFLAGLWLTNDEVLVFTGALRDGAIEEGTEAVWRRRVGGGDWSRLDVPPPAGSRTTQRLPVLAGDPEERLLVYPSGPEAVVAVSLTEGTVRHAVEPAELVGPSPGGGFLLYRDDASGGTSLTAVGADSRTRWTRRFSDLREEIAAKLGKKPVEVVFNDASTSHLPLEEDGDWVGVTLVFSDIGWKEGIPGFYIRLRGADGALLDAVAGRGVSGRPMSAEGSLWYVSAPPKEKGEPAVTTVDLDAQPAAEDAEAGISRRAGLSPAAKKAVHGYALGPRGERLAVSWNGDTTELRIFRKGKEEPRVIPLD